MVVTGSLSMFFVFRGVTTWSEVEPCVVEKKNEHVFGFYPSAVFRLTVAQINHNFHRVILCVACFACHVVKLKYRLLARKLFALLWQISFWVVLTALNVQILKHCQIQTICPYKIFIFDSSLLLLLLFIPLDSFASSFPSERTAGEMSLLPFPPSQTHSFLFLLFRPILQLDLYFHDVIVFGL